MSNPNNNGLEILCGIAAAVVGFMCVCVMNGLVAVHFGNPIGYALVGVEALLVVLFVWWMSRQ